MTSQIVFGVRGGEVVSKDVPNGSKNVTYGYSPARDIFLLAVHPACGVRRETYDMLHDAEGLPLKA